MMMEMKEAQHIREFTKKTKAKAHTPHKGIVEVVTIVILIIFLMLSKKHNIQCF